MTARVSPTLAICLAAGVAAGIALARPATSAPDADATGAGSVPAVVDADRRPGASLPIEIESSSFTSVVVPAGSVVEVRNLDGIDHTVTADDGAFDTGVIRGGGAATFVASTEPGVYPFICALHPAMSGSLVVE